MGSNVQAEKALGKFGVLCVEDIVDILSSDPMPKDESERQVELHDGRVMDKSERFDEVARRINPFRLNAIKVPVKGLRTPFNKRGYWGYRGSFINTFVEK